VIDFLNQKEPVEMQVLFDQLGNIPAPEYLPDTFPILPHYSMFSDPDRLKSGQGVNR
jgi:hypothetical protein